MSLIENGNKAAKDHALAIKTHRIAHFLHARVVHHFFLHSHAHIFGRVFEPAEHYLFVILGLDCTAKVGKLAIGNIIFPAFNKT